MKRSDGTISILDHYGQPLLEDDYKPLSIGTTVINPQAAYPGAIPPIRLGDPTTGQDVTGLLRGGKLGALIELRDQTSAALPGAARRVFPDAVRDVQHRRPDAVHRHQREPYPPIRRPRHRSATPTRSRFRRPSRTTRPCCATATPRQRTGAADSTLLRTIVDSVLGSKQTFQTGSPISPNGLGPNSNLSTSLPASTDFASFATELVSYQVNQRANATSQLEIGDVSAGPVEDQTFGSIRREPRYGGFAANPATALVFQLCPGGVHQPADVQRSHLDRALT